MLSKVENILSCQVFGWFQLRSKKVPPSPGEDLNWFGSGLKGGPQVLLVESMVLHCRGSTLALWGNILKGSHASLC